MSLCDPDPGASYDRDGDVTAAALRNTNELAGVGETGGTGSSRRSDLKSLQENEK